MSDFGLFAPHNNLMPLGSLLPFAVAVFVRFVSGQGEIRNCLPAAGIPRFRIAPQASHQNHFVYRHSALVYPPPGNRTIARCSAKGKPTWSASLYAHSGECIGTQSGSANPHPCFRLTLRTGFCRKSRTRNGKRETSAVCVLP